VSRTGHCRQPREGAARCRLHRARHERPRVRHGLQVWQCLRKRWRGDVHRQTGSFGGKSRDTRSAVAQKKKKKKNFRGTAYPLSNPLVRVCAFRLHAVYLVQHGTEHTSSSRQVHHRPHTHAPDAIIPTIPTGPRRQRKCVSVQPFGAFVELGPGREGLVHVSQMDLVPVTDATAHMSVGDRWALFVLPGYALLRERLVGCCCCCCCWVWVCLHGIVSLARAGLDRTGQGFGFLSLSHSLTVSLSPPINSGRSLGSL
jgi:hypothetical protein